MADRIVPQTAAAFDQRKDALLEALGCGSDRSKKGSFDAPIQTMLSHLNEHSDYMSTSSCSGRTVLFREHGSGMGSTAKGGEWIMCKHGEVTAEELAAGVKHAATGKGLVYLRHEPFILHVQCKNLAAATALMEVARAGGYRESGMSVGKKHVMVAIRTSSLRMDCPIAEDGEMLSTEEHIKVLLRLSNEKCAKNVAKSDALYGLLRTHLLHSTPPPNEDGGERPAKAEEARDEAPEGVFSVVVDGAVCEAVRKEAIERGWLDKTRRNSRVQGQHNRIALPILPQAVAELRRGGGGGDGLAGMITKGVAEVVEGADACPSAVGKAKAAEGGGGVASSPHVKLSAGMRALGRECGVDVGSLEVPLKRWEEYGDLAHCAGDWLQCEPWCQLPPESVWECVAKSLGKSRIAVKAEVDEGPMRQSHSVLVYPPMGGDGWVKTVQHGVSFEWDVTKVMFSRGNVGERQRMGNMRASGETFVDLFAGIGYFTVPLLVRAGANQGYCCEWNPDSVQALKRNLEANGVAHKCQVFLGDNRETSPKLSGVADRVLLGLLPSSEAAWPLAVSCLKPEGGMLHVHENVGEAEMSAWTKKLETQVTEEAAKAGRNWCVKVLHVERVKTYAPRVWHIVADTECRPVA